jgi:hypothetical protein
MLASLSFLVFLSKGPLSGLTWQGALCFIAEPERETALDEFYEQWKGDALVILKWIALQVGPFLRIPVV